MTGIFETATETPTMLPGDLRELVRGSPSQAGTWDQRPDPATVLVRARALGLSRALYCAMQVLAYFFPEAHADALRLDPSLPAAMRALLDAAVVEPSKKLDRTRVNRVTEEVRRLLL